MAYQRVSYDHRPKEMTLWNMGLIKQTFLSRNPFDVTGARAAGLHAFWVDRSKTGWLDKISPEGHDFSPDKVVASLQEIVDFLENYVVHT